MLDLDLSHRRDRDSDLFDSDVHIAMQFSQESTNRYGYIDLWHLLE